MSTEKSIEIYYDVADMSPEALDFRNAAMELIETEMEKAGIGEWEGAEIGKSIDTDGFEVNFGFSVTDFDAAEALVRQTVAGTPFEGIREIKRNEY